MRGRDRRQFPVRLILRRTLVVLPVVRPQRRRALGLRGDRQRRVHPEVRRDRGAVHDVERRVVVHALIGVDDAVIGAVADGRPTQEMRGERDVEQLAPGAARDAVDLLRHPPGELVPHRDPRRIRLAVALLGRHDPLAAGPTLGEGGDRVVQMLHHQGDDRPFTPAGRVQQPDQLALDPGDPGSRNCRQRGTSVPSGPVPSVISVCSSPIALEPLP